MVLSKLKQNIAALGSIQVANYLFPLITLPYVTRVLGVEAWGTLSWVQIVLGYFTLVTNWGFAISGTRKIAAIQNDSTTVNQVFLSAWCAQWLLSIICVAVLFALIQLNSFFSERAEFFYWGTGLIISGIMFPIWFLNGLEQMRTVAVTQILTRVLTLPLIFILIDGADDAPKIVMIGVIQSVVSGAIALWWINRNLTMQWFWPSASSVRLELRDGFSIFLSTIWIGLYTTITPTMLGVFAGSASVGYYSIADRTRMLAQSILTPISQALFPRMSNLFAVDQEAAWRLIRKSSIVILSVSAITSVTLYTSATLIIELLAGPGFKDSVPVLRLMAFLPFIISLSNIFGIQILLPKQQTITFNRILFFAGMLSLMIIIPLITQFAEKGAAINVLLIESFVTLSMGYFVYRLLKNNNNQEDL